MMGIPILLDAAVHAPPSACPNEPVSEPPNEEILPPVKNIGLYSKAKVHADDNADVNALILIPAKQSSG